MCQDSISGTLMQERKSFVSSRHLFLRTGRASPRQDGVSAMAASDLPVGEREGIAELLDTLEMSGVARNQLQAVLQGDGRNHRVGRADGTS